MYVCQYLADQRVAFETMLHPPAFTAQKRAKYLRVSGHHLVKSVLLKGPRGYLLAILPAPKHVDLEALSVQLEGPVALASEEQIAQVFADCELGSLTPFGSLYGISTLLEASIPSDSIILCEAQRHAVTIRMLCRDLERIERPRRLPFAK